MDWSPVIFPQNVPTTGKANYQPTPVGPVTAVSNRTPQYTPPPVTAVLSSQQNSNQPQIGKPVYNKDPFNTSSPQTALPNRTPLETPIGVYPQFETPTENWTYDYGNGGGY